MTRPSSRILKAKLDARRGLSTADDGEYDYNIKRRTAQGEVTPFDGSGRFIMPGFPRFHARIGANAFFYGVFDYFEIWDPKTLDRSGGHRRAGEVLRALSLPVEGDRAVSPEPSVLPDLYIPGPARPSRRRARRYPGERHADATFGAAGYTRARCSRSARGCSRSIAIPMRSWPVGRWKQHRTAP